MKQINEKSDLKLGIYLIDVNGRPIDPSTVDLSVSLYTVGLNSINFSTENSVTTNCKLRNSAIILAVKNHPLGAGVIKADKGDVVRIFGDTNVDDGVFLQVNNGSHLPLFELVTEANVFSEIPEDVLYDNDIVPIELYDGVTKVDSKLYRINIDVKTNAITVVKKK